MERQTITSQRDGGFTLVELLVVVLIIAILAAIAIPAFLHQRERAYVADLQSTLRNAATAAEAYALPSGGSYAGMDWSTLQSREDAKSSASQSVSVVLPVDDAAYCIEVLEGRLSASHEWNPGHFVSRGSDAGSPRPGPCPAAF